MKLPFIVWRHAIGARFIAQSANAAQAAAADCEFLPFGTKDKRCESAVISVKPAGKRTAKPVAKAAIFPNRSDREPDGMVTQAPVEPKLSKEPGVGQFKAELAMAGGWCFSIAAELQSEADALLMQSVLEVVE